MQTTRKMWSEQEVRYLRELYLLQGLSALKISKILQRSKTSTWLKIKRLKLRHAPEQTAKIKSENTSGVNNPAYGKPAWSKGQNKHTNSILKKASIKMSLTKKEMFRTGLLDLSGSKNGMYGRDAWNKGLTKENCNRIKISGEKGAKTRREKWILLPENEKQRIRKHCAIIGAKCNKKGTSIEIKMGDFLRGINIHYIPNHYWEGFVFDFYLPNHNTVIECQGDYWHGNPRKYGSSNLNAIQLKNIERDKRKLLFLQNNNMPSIFLWEYDINRDFENVKKRIVKTLANE